MKFFIKVICNANRDTTSSIILMCDSSVILTINLCDGWQRQAGASKIKLATCNNILVSSTDANCVGGFPGFYLTANDAVKEKGFNCAIYGPAGLEEYFGTLALDAYPKLWKTVETTDKTLDFEIDSKVKVFPIVLKLDKEAPGISKQIISYFIEPLTPKPKFKGDEAKKMGLTVDQIKILVSGKDITLADGKIIKSDSMMQAQAKPNSFLYLHIPNIAYLDSLFASKQIIDIISKNPNIGLIYHSISSDVSKNEKYLEFISKITNFPKVQHIFDVKEFNIDTVPRYYQQIFAKQLHEYNDRIFPEIPLSPIHTKNELLFNEFIKNYAVKNKDKPTLSEFGRDYTFWPSFEISKQISLNGLHTPAIVKTDLKSIEENLTKLKSNEKLLTLFKQCKEIAPTRKFKNEPNFVILGTASQKPLKYRCVSSLFVTIPGNLESKLLSTSSIKDYYSNSYGILMDTGEGCYGQLYDFINNETALANALENLSIIFISHYHGDHTFGLAKLLHEIDNIFISKFGPIPPKTDFLKIKPLFVIVPKNMLKTVDLMLKMNSVIYTDRIKIIECENINPDPAPHYCLPEEGPVPETILPQEKINELISSLFKNASPNIQEMWVYLSKALLINRAYTFQTNHCHGSHGIIFESDSWKFGYTADTCPCISIENFAKNCDLLIHECTFSDNVPRKEDDICHTTMAQILNIFDKTTPWRMLLTHFSNKTNKIVNLTDEHLKRKVFTAFDLMKFKLSDAEWIYQLQPLLEALITND